MSVNVLRSSASSSPRAIDSRCANSASRSRPSAAPPTPATIHCRAFPHKCNTRLPILFDSSFGRHQICSSVNRSRQRSIFGRYSSTRNSRAQEMNLSVVVVIGVDTYCSQKATPVNQMPHSGPFVLSRIRTPLVLRFALRRPRDFIRLCMRQRMPRRCDGLANAVKHRPRLCLRLRWRTSSRHIQPPLRFSRNCVMLAPPRNGVNKHTYPKRICEDLPGLKRLTKCAGTRD